MKQIKSKWKYILLGFLCLILLPVFPLVLGIYLAYRLYKRASNKRKGMGIATLIVIVSLFLSGVTVSAFPSSTPKTPSPTPIADATPIAPGGPTEATLAESKTSEVNTNIEIQKGQTESATVVKVVDGDTMDFSINGKTERIRVIGINTPETVDPRKSVECFGQEASRQAKLYLETGMKVELEADPTQGERDKYQRLLRYVWTDDGTVDFGKVMISLGYAYEYTYNTPYKYQSIYKQAQKEAEEGKKGLWADNACVSTPKPTAKPTTAPVTNSGGSGTYSGSYSCTGPDLDCSDFSTHAQAQSFFDSCGFTATYDPMKLDSVGVGDGVACESLP